MIPIYEQRRFIEFVERYWSDTDKAPKHERLRRAIRTSIHDGYWQAGARLPAERDWVDAVPCSLGTVQRALRELVADGVIERKRGSGTIVAYHEDRIAEPWHMRFYRNDEKDGNFLPVFTRVLKRVKLKQKGPWTSALGQTDGSVVRIDRIFSINEELDVYSVFYALSGRFPDLESLPLQSLKGADFKLLIAQHHHVPVHKVVQAMRFEVPPDQVASESDCVAGQLTMVLDVTAYSHDGEPIYYQNYYIPPNNFRLDLGTAMRD
ncbi:MAG: GntR family transcriptional regulator [Rhodospirillales bacterium]|nr:GntR family transcriptional regulator [Rhodospirillales bacterium]